MRGCRRYWAGLLAVSALLVAGCTSTQAQSGPADGTGGASSTAPQPEPKPLSLTLRPDEAATEVAPGDAVMVKADNGELSDVELVGADGTVVDGKMNSKKSSWAASEPLGFGKEYTLSASGVGDDGEKDSAEATFTTVTPAQQAAVQVTIPDGATVGVGMAVPFEFTAPIADKVAVEEMLQIEPSKDTEGAFHWFSDTQVVWRPKEYWTPGTEVDIAAEIYGKDLGDGIYGASDQSASMTIGKKVEAVADGKKHEMTVKVGDSTKKMPISMGKPTHPTPEGTYTVMSEHQPYTMDSSTYGVPTDSAEGYRTTVTHAGRMSHSGIFYHSAPWSVYAQGSDNVSHGCINLSTEDADWLMKKSKPGDIITVTNSGGQELEPTDGWSYWQMSWDEWESGGQD